MSKRFFNILSDPTGENEIFATVTLHGFFLDRLAALHAIVRSLGANYDVGSTFLALELYDTTPDLACSAGLDEEFEVACDHWIEIAEDREIPKSREPVRADLISMHVREDGVYWRVHIKYARHCETGILTWEQIEGREDAPADSA